jgi:predicted Rossmann fold nucleotide-binding protein DprA/Smf involved in DNA uptake
MIIGILESSLSYEKVLTIIGIASSILTIVFTALSIVSWVKTNINHKKAKESEIKAKEYADNANKAYMAVEKYYSACNDSYEKQTRILSLIADNFLITTKRIASESQLPIEEVKKILLELIIDKKIKNCDGNKSNSDDDAKWTLMK